MSAADSFIGDGLADSPYAEAMKQIEGYQSLVSIYERVLATKNKQINQLVLSLDSARRTINWMAEAC
jgi:hypothetical protein